MGACCVVDDDHEERVNNLEETAQKDMTSNVAQPTAAVEEAYNGPDANTNNSAKADNVASAVNQITVRVIQGRNLPKYDPGPLGKCDPFVVVQIGEDKFKTESIMREHHPTWNAVFVSKGEGILFGIERILFEVKDYDRFSKNDVMGTFEIPLPPKSELLADYTTPVQWIPLQNAEQKDGGAGEIQVQIEYVTDVSQSQFDTRYFTHVMELEIKSASDLIDMDFIGKSDPYVRVEWGSQAYQTSVDENKNKHPQWNESVFLFIHQDFQSKYRLKFSVLDSDLKKDDLLGTGYLSAEQIFAKFDANMECTMEVPLNLVSVNLDTKLEDVETLDENQRPKACGTLLVKARARKRSDVEQGFVAALFQEFDVNNDGVLNKFEVHEMLMSLHLTDEALDATAIMNKFDQDYNETLSKEEVANMFNDVQFQNSPLSSSLMNMYLHKSLGEQTRDLMSPFKNTGSGETNKVINILDRHSGLIVQEFIPKYVWFALKVVYDLRLSRKVAQGKVGHKLLAKMSRKKGVEMNDPKSQKQIRPFMVQYAIDAREFLVPPAKFATFNDFFARAIDTEVYRPMPDDEMLVVSPADCRMVVFENILSTTKLWIKGDEFTLEKLLGERVGVLTEKPGLLGGCFFISRLAPQDYHRWHYPVSGTVTSITPIDGALYTVNPIAINKNVNVYTETKRCIIELECGPAIGTVVMFAIAATMVGSYNLFSGTNPDDVSGPGLPLQVGDKVKRGDVAGEFRFGGSTVLTLLELGRIKFDDDLLQNSRKPIETLMTVRARVGRIVAANAETESSTEYAGGNTNTNTNTSTTTNETAVEYANNNNN